MSNQLRTLHQLSSELEIDACWIEVEAIAGRLPCLRLPGRDGLEHLQFHVDAVANTIAMRAVNASEPVDEDFDEPNSKQSEANGNA